MRAIPDPGFADDDGSASAEVLAALTSYGEDPDARHEATLAVVQAARLLVPVVAVLGEVEEEVTADGRTLTHDKTSDMATVLMQGLDGRTALLAFTGTETLRRWDPAARPVPVPAARAAEAALQDGAAALVLDVAGPVTFVVEEADLRALAAGSVLVRLGAGDRDGVSGRYGWVTPGR
jgi:hypothetical protein